MEHRRLADNARAVASQWEAERLEEIRNLPDEDFDRLTIDQIREEMSPEGGQRFLALVRERAVARQRIGAGPDVGSKPGSAPDIPRHALPKAFAFLVLIGMVAGAATGGALATVAAWNWASDRLARWWAEPPSANIAPAAIPPAKPSAGPGPAPQDAPPAPRPTPSVRLAPAAPPPRQVAAPEVPSVLGVGVTSRTTDLAGAPSWASSAATPRPLRAGVNVDILRRTIGDDGELWLYVRAGSYAAGIAGWLPADALNGVRWVGK